MCLNEVFDNYFGINDDDLALTVWKLCQTSNELGEFREMVSDELADMGLPDDIIEKLWIVCTASNGTSIEEL